MSLRDATRFLTSLNGDRAFSDRFVKLRGNVIGFQTALSATGLNFTVAELRTARAGFSDIILYVEPFLADLQNERLGYLANEIGEAKAADWWGRQVKD